MGEMEISQKKAYAHLFPTGLIVCPRPNTKSLSVQNVNSGAVHAQFKKFTQGYLYHICCGGFILNLSCTYGVEWSPGSKDICVADEDWEGNLLCRLSVFPS